MKRKSFHWFLNRSAHLTHFIVLEEKTSKVGNQACIPGLLENRDGGWAPQYISIEWMNKWMKHLYEKFSFQGQAWVYTLKGNISHLEYKMLEEEESRGRGNHRSDGHDLASCLLGLLTQTLHSWSTGTWFTVHCPAKSSETLSHKNGLPVTFSKALMSFMREKASPSWTAVVWWSSNAAAMRSGSRAPTPTPTPPLGAPGLWAGSGNHCSSSCLFQWTHIQPKKARSESCIRAVRRPRSGPSPSNFIV